MRVEFVIKKSLNLFPSSESFKISSRAVRVLYLDIINEDIVPVYVQCGSVQRLLFKCANHKGFHPPSPSSGSSSFNHHQCCPCEEARTGRVCV